MKRYSTKTWAAALVLAITAADCVGIYVAQVRLHREVPITAPESAYADAAAVKDSWRGAGLSPEAQRAFASTLSYTTAANAQNKASPTMPNAATLPQRLAQADIKVPAFKPRTDAFLAAPRLAEAAPPEKVELATEVHAVQHRAALHRTAARLAQKTATPPTSMSFAAAFGGSNAGTAALALPEPSFGKQADDGSVSVDLAKTSTTVTDAPHTDMATSVTIGKSAQASTEALDPELPAVSVPVQSAAIPGI
ncbi:hypothetical protein [Novosphingobium sp.]|uniref:hypothetical protein n=1 Tax=Novosphingobium sp. TaxID=1874826 RepID=UPI0025E01B2D|nr:hypothetical protein [Novosphingobium sp.]